MLFLSIEDERRKTSKISELIGPLFLSRRYCGAPLNKKGILADAQRPEKQTACPLAGGLGKEVQSRTNK